MAAAPATHELVGRPAIGAAARLGLAGAALVAAVASVPYVYAAVAAPAGRVFTGLLFDVPDHAQYWSWVTASRQGLFIPNTMTPEPNDATFLNPMMWLLARVQALFGLSFAALFQWWRVAAVVILGPALAVITALLARSRASARTAFWIALAGGGFGWLLVGAKYALRLADAPFPQAIYTVEPNTWFGLMAYPYLPLAQGFMLVALAGAYLAHVRPSAGAFAAAALGALGVALVHAYDLVVVYAVLGVFWIVEVVRTRTVPRSLTAAGVLLGLCSGPVAVYYQVLTSTDPLWREILGQYVNAGVWTPNPPLLVVLMGAPLVLAAMRLPGLDWNDPRMRFTATWACTQVLLIYVPTVFQVKLLAAFQVPLALLAADLWTTRVAPALRARGALLPAVALAALILPTNLYLIPWKLIELRRADSELYLTADEAAALQALAAVSGPHDVALAVEAVGRWIPNEGRTRAFLAHWAMTNRYFARRDAAQAFFSPATADASRRALLDAHGVTLVVWTARADASGATFRPASSPLFEPVFERPTAGVYRVRSR